MTKSLIFLPALAAWVAIVLGVLDFISQHLPVIK